MPEKATQQTAPVDWNPISPLWAESWWLCRALACAEADKLDWATTQTCASLLIAESRKDWVQLRTLRELLLETTGRGSVSFLSDSEVIARILRLLRSGEVHMHAAIQPRVAGMPASSAGTSSTEGSSASTPTRRDNPGNFAPRDSDPSAFNNNLDAAAQAAALTQAAKNGVPFCEECQKQAAP